MPDETIRCPACQFECKAWATVCASCMVEFQKWLGAHPGQSIQGWKPGQRPVVPAPSAQAPLDPIDGSSTGQNFKTAGAVLAVIAGFQILIYFLIGFISDKEEEQDLLKLGCVASFFIFGGLSIGALKGKKICIWVGLALIVLDWVYTMTTNPTMALRGVILKVYFIYILYKSATA